MKKTLNLRNTKKLPITDDLKEVYDIAFRRKRFGEKARKMALSISPWLQRLTKAYMDRGVYPILPYNLANAYENKDDKVIAILVGCLCLSFGKEDVVMNEMTELRNIMGEHPYKDFFADRGFVMLSLPENQEKHIGGFGSMSYLKISKTVEGLWNTWEDYGKVSLFEIFRELVNTKNISPHNALILMVGGDFIKSQNYRINVALLALCSTYGIGVGLWHFEGIESKLDIPVDLYVKRFLKLLVPDMDKAGMTDDEAALTLGFNTKSDIWYCYNAYMELGLTKLTEMTRYIRRYHTQVKNNRSDFNNRKQLRLLEPAIEFSKFG